MAPRRHGQCQLVHQVTLDSACTGWTLRQSPTQGQEGECAGEADATRVAGAPFQGHKDDTVRRLSAQHHVGALVGGPGSETLDLPAASLLPLALKTERAPGWSRFLGLMGFPTAKVRKAQDALSKEHTLTHPSLPRALLAVTTGPQRPGKNNPETSPVKSQVLILLVSETRINPGAHDFMEVTALRQEGGPMCWAPRCTSRHDQSQRCSPAGHRGGARCPAAFLRNDRVRVTAHARAGHPSLSVQPEPGQVPGRQRAKSSRT